MSNEQLYQEPQQEPQERLITYATITLGELTREGDALAEMSSPDAEGNPITYSLRVPAGLPGELVTIAIEAPATPRPGRHRRHWKPRPPRVWITEIHQPSPLRIKAICPVFGTCGGCQLQHMHYAAQLKWKRHTVQQLLLDIGGFSDPPLLDTVPCDTPWQYRNHMRFSVNRSGQAGLTARGSHRVLPLTHCPIAHAKINRALTIISEHENARPQVLIRCSDVNNQLLMQPTPSAEIAQRISDTGLELHSETMEEGLADATFRIRPSSFFQTNTAQAEKMVQMVRAGLLHSATNVPLDTLTIVDAYCGVGTFARVLAPHVGKVIAIEESASAIKDAQWNLRDVQNVEIRKGKVEALLPNLATHIDGLVIDPPRAGCQQVVLDALIQNPVTRIVYVSCDPATLARDLNILCHLQPIYQLRSIQPLDMFPQTAHIECVALLERAS